VGFSSTTLIRPRTTRMSSCSGYRSLRLGRLNSSRRGASRQRGPLRCNVGQPGPRARGRGVVSRRALPRFTEWRAREMRVSRFLSLISPAAGATGQRQGLPRASTQHSSRSREQNETLSQGSRSLHRVAASIRAVAHAPLVRPPHLRTSCRSRALDATGLTRVRGRTWRVSAPRGVRPRPQCTKR
jgi:hypothetical protein